MYSKSNLLKLALVLAAVAMVILIIQSISNDNRLSQVRDMLSKESSVSHSTANKPREKDKKATACPIAALCGSTNESVTMHLETMHIDTLKFLLHGMLTSVEFSCTTLKLFGRVGEGNYPICMNSSSIIPAPGNCLIYSFGISHDWSFDEDFAKYGCEVHSFDPSIGKPDHTHAPNISFHNMGLFGFDFTGSNGWKYQKLSTIRKMLRHEKRVIDVLKIDAEGAEWSFLRSVVIDDVDQLLTVKQIVFELHTPSGGARAMTAKDYAEIIQYLMELRRLGFVVYINFLNNYCCANFTPLMPPGIAEKCCHETSYVNSHYLNR